MYDRILKSNNMKLLITAFSILMSMSVFGQNVYIPDVAFKAYLVGNSAININGDDEIQISEAVAFGGGIFCYNLNISDLTGIEAFTALTFLECSSNLLTSLDVSTSTNLEALFCSNNLLTYLNVSNNPILNHLYCYGNLLTSLDVSNTPCGNWQEPWFSGAGESLLNGYADNPSLFCIQVDNVNCWNNNSIGSINTSYQYYSEDCNVSSINELNDNNKTVTKIIDALGREVKQTKNQLLFHIYDDGSVEKKFVVE
jgi:hypothetical protein